MTILAGILLATLNVLPADRLALADRLFNKASYAEARTEYAALKGEASVAADELLFRLGECDRLLDRKVEALAAYDELLKRFPDSVRANEARLQKALLGPEAEQAGELAVLDSDRVAPAIRAAALYHLGFLKRDAAILARAIKADPKGRYAAYANFHRASILSASEKSADRREAVSSLLAIAFGGASELAEEALYLAAAQSYRDRRYDEAGSLFRRYLKTYPKATRAEALRVQTAWCDYLGGKYADARAYCDTGSGDDCTYLRAMCRVATGADDAKAALDRYLESFPEGRYRASAELALARLGFEAAARAKTSPDLVAHAQRAAELSKAASDLLRLGWAYERTGQDERARETYQRVMSDAKAGAARAEAAYLKAMIDLRASRWEAAELALAQALASGALSRERTASANYWRGMAALRLEHAAEGEAFLKKALAGGLALDESREARLALADGDLKRGNAEAAKKAYATLVGEGAVARMGAAKIHQVRQLLRGLPEAKICAEALSKSEAAEWRQRGFVALGEEAEAAKDFAVAVASYRKALDERCALSDEAARALPRLGELEFRNAEYDRAETTLKRAVNALGDDASARAGAYLLLAKTCAAKGDVHAARGYATVVTSLFDEPALVREAEEILKRHPEAAK